MTELADTFVKRGGKHLFLDEVHKYPQWSTAIKNIYDDYTDLQIVFTGSSLLEILKARADLSRRAVVYSMQGLSLREYLHIKGELEFPSIKLSSIFEDHESLSEEIIKKTKPLKHFNDYITKGYYPFFLEGEQTYAMKLEETILMLLEVELPLLRNIEISHIIKVKPGRFRQSSQLPVFEETVVGVHAENDVIEEVDSQRFSRLTEPLRNFAVLDARVHIAGGVVVGDNNGGRPVGKRVGEHLPGVDKGPIEDTDGDNTGIHNFMRAV